MATDDFAGIADALLGNDIVVHAIPAAYFRIVLATSAEHRLSTLFSSALVSGLSYHLFRNEAGSWINVAVVVLAQLATLSLFSRSTRWMAVGLLLLCAAAALASAALSPPAGGTDNHTLLSVAGGLLVAASLAALAPAVAQLLLTRRRQLITVPTLIALAAVAVALPAPHARDLGSAAMSAASNLLPIQEFAQAHATMLRFVERSELDKSLSSLALVTIHCQYSLGRLGVTYLRSAQLRKNRLLAVGADADDPKRLPAAAFARSVGLFILTSGLPYMAQRRVKRVSNAARSSHT